MCNSNFKLKKILSVLLALSVVLACACAKSEETTKKTKKTRTKNTEDSAVTDTTEKATESDSEISTESTTEVTQTTLAPAPSTFDTDKAKEYMNSINFDGVVLVAEGDQIVWTYAEGMADRENKTPNTLDTVFEFGSITKQFTAVAIMQLEEKGLLSTDDKLDKYIPEYKYADQITIHQLLNMTSGVSDYLFNGMLGFSFDEFDSMTVDMLLDFENTMTKIVTTPLAKDEFVTKLSEYPLDFTPGSEYAYSNSNYYLLGIIIEKLSGMSYDEYVRKNILEPLALSDLYPDIDHLTSDGRLRLLIMNFDLPHQDPTISYAVGVMTGTAEGLFNWEKCVMDKALLSQESWDKILDGGSFGYGYGWYIENGYIEHSGMTLGYNTSVRVASESRRVIVVLSNIQLLEGTSNEPMASEVGEELWKYYG
ncbi:MAG: beta-lactamase family protein [Clostridiales bacterium]|nr:beta-lactamase family protein [Clostridiales bacterium]